MANLISLGAINKVTGKYVYPPIAKKADEYVCPDCNNDVIVVKGKILRHHFRHKNDKERPCYYYDKPNESQIHKDAKMLMKTLLENKIPIEFKRTCQSCQKSDIIKLPKITKDSIITLEHRFTYNNKLKIADVAHTQNGEIQCIYEICHTHQTSDEDRPEPWVEVDARKLIHQANNRIVVLYGYVLNISCKRLKCDSCIKKQQQEKKKQEQEQQELIKQHEIYKIKNTKDLIRELDRISFVWLNVPYSQKDDIKKMGGKWDNEHKLWYISREKYKHTKHRAKLDQYVVWWVCQDCENMNAICDDCWENDICLTEYIGDSLDYSYSFYSMFYIMNHEMENMMYLHPTARLKALFVKLADYIIKQHPPESKLKNAKKHFH